MILFRSIRKYAGEEFVGDQAERKNIVFRADMDHSPGVFGRGITRSANECAEIGNADGFVAFESHGKYHAEKIDKAKGNTVLRYEDSELRNNTTFAVGQTLTAQRLFSYGNLRDSNAEPAIYSFADKTYGTRAGQPYPMWNWCVLFTHFPISDQE